MTFAEIEEAWRQCGMREVKRRCFVEEVIPNFLSACHTAVETGDEQALRSWLDEKHNISQAIQRFKTGTPADNDYALTFRAHLLCARQALLSRRSDRTPEPELHGVADETGMAMGFLRGLTEAFLSQDAGGESCAPVRSQSLPALLVDEDQGEGAVATLTLDLLPSGDRMLYPTPRLAFRAADFRQAESDARESVLQGGAWPDGQDVRWRLARRDGRPLTLLTGPSLGLALALGLSRLFAGGP